MFRLIIDPPLDGATNMARDEALLVLHSRGEAPPTLRLYQWWPTCLSLGRFQRAAEINRERCAAEGVQVVRRPSGGRALLHGAECTYAIVAGEHTALGGSSISASYQAISRGLLAGINRLGAGAVLARGEERRANNLSRPPAGGKARQGNGVLPQRLSAACYDSPAAYEVVVAGRKLIGSAQRRQNGAFLQHGAIPFTPNVQQLCAILRQPPIDLAERMTTLAQALGRDVLFSEVAQALVEGCAGAWGVRFAPGQWSAGELALAAELRATKYLDEAWTWAR